MSADAASAGGTARAATGALALRIFGCFAAGYFMSYGLRSVNAVLAPELTAELGLTHAQLGSLSSAYFLAFAAMQIPLGVWLDRYGPRRVDAVLMGAAALGCAAFAVATSFGALWLGRALIGAGVSGALMASLTAYRQWFPAERQTRLAAWMLMAGTVGVLTTTVPVHRALPVLGWRGVFWAAAALLAAIGVAMWVLLPRDHERARAPGAGGASFVASLSGYREVFSNGYFWRMTMTAGVIQGGFVSMQSLWVGPWFASVLGVQGAERADLLFAFNFGLMLCFLALGWVAPRVGAERAALARVVAIGTVAVVALELAIAWAHGPSAWWLWLAYAAAATVYTLVQPRVGLAFPAHLAGRALTGFNLLIFSWMFASQWGFGLAIDAFRSGGLDEIAAFRAAMVAFAVLHAACLVLFVAWPRRWGGR
ncbi:MAG TPA: MFS transporter [Burkholderiaceae bacterium]|nr:MFS transporter [Burkholderiaceae bacterium]